MSQQPSEPGANHSNINDNATQRQASFPLSKSNSLTPDALQSQLKGLLARKRDLQRQRSEAAVKFKAASEASTSRRRELRAAALAQADVVAGTLSGMGGSDLAAMLALHHAWAQRAQRERGVGDASAGRAAAGAARWPAATTAQPPPNAASLLFDAIVCDEAAQAIEPSVLIPLHLLSPAGVLVMVGDPCQLPATVISRAAAQGLAQSLFERCQRAGARTLVLSRQYRMHPAISAWPAARFYGGRLKDAVTAADRAAPFHAQPCFAPLAFFDCREVRLGGQGIALVLVVVRLCLGFVLKE